MRARLRITACTIALVLLDYGRRLKALSSSVRPVRERPNSCGSRLFLSDWLQTSSAPDGCGNLSLICCLLVMYSFAPTGNALTMSRSHLDFNGKEEQVSLPLVSKDLVLTLHHDADMPSKARTQRQRPPNLLTQSRDRRFRWCAKLNSAC